MEKMNDKLYNWLYNEWRYSNLPKYMKYFESWVNNLTENQILGFKHYMEWYIKK